MENDRFTDDDPLTYTAEDYFSQLTSIDQDDLHPEFHTYATVWIRSNFPVVYKRLAKSFRRNEAEIYAHAQTPVQGELF
ncbi:MAG: hypothetical protein CL885_04140 [Dehalococcoidia bacterium]|nr:hypothetical protein [Dehalococcoidia bacterium]|tara:strand:+ start:647 stop:883 length:237 start_codon:yes stop_codon:yes gene_type:complete